MLWTSNAAQHKIPAIETIPNKNKKFPASEGIAPYTPSDYGIAYGTTPAATGAVTLASPVLTLYVISDSQINKTWPAIANATGYRGRMNTTTDFGSSTQVYDDTLLLHNSTGLQPNTTYYFWWQTKGNGTTYLDSPWALFSAKTSVAQPPTFNTILTFVTSAYDNDQGVNGYTGVSNATKQFHVNLISPRTGTPFTMRLKIALLTEIAIDTYTDYLGQPCKYIHSNGVNYYLTF